MGLGLTHAAGFNDGQGGQLAAAPRPPAPPGAPAPPKPTGLRLKPQVDSYRHVYRGLVWYVFHDRASHRTYRVSGDGADLIGALDGRRGLDEILAAFQSRPPGRSAAPDAAHLSHFVAQLDQLDLLDTETGLSIAQIDARARAARRRRWIGQLRSPMSFRIPLFDPTRLLDGLMPAMAWLFTPVGAAIWLAVVATGAVIGLLNWGVLTNDVADRLLSAENLVVAGLVYPVVKALHELGHGLVLRRLGLEVHQVGILIAAFIPTPYVDASAANLLQRRRDRILVGAAGMMAEMFVGGMALLLWANAEPGALRAVCYNVIFISGFSTLLFNGNPLQRYDGYYILTDLIGMPGLGARSSQYLAACFRRIVMGDHATPVPAGSRSEKALYLLYGPASFLYRCGLMLVISFYVARRYPEFGLLLGAWTILGYLSPAAAGLGAWIRRNHGVKARVRESLVRESLLRESLLHGSLLRGSLGLGALVAAAGTLLFVVPAPYGVVAQGVVAMPDNDIVRPGVAGTIAAMKLQDGDAVSAGQVVAQLADPLAAARLARAAGHVAEMRARTDQALGENPVQAAILAEDLKQAERQRQDAAHAETLLQVRSPASGRLVVALGRDLEGRFVQRGETLATVWDPSRAVIRTMVALSDAALLRTQAGRVEIRPGWDVSQTMAGQVVRRVPQATDTLPSPSLSLDGGGPFAGARDADHQFHAPEALFEIDIRPDTPLPVPFLNGRMFVRFALPPQPAGLQIWRSVRLVFLRWLNE